jgi:hypothetical protein
MNLSRSIIYAALAISASSAVAGEVNTHLRPLSTVQAVQVQTGIPTIIPFFVSASSDVDVWVDSANPATLSVRLPDGSIVSPQFPGTSGLTVDAIDGAEGATSEALLGTRTAMVLGLPHPSLGWHQLIVESQVHDTAVVRISGGSANVRGALLIGNGSALVTAGDAITLSAVLSAGDPVVGANVLARAYLNNEVAAETPLRDDGVLPDAAALDGIYSGSVVLPNDGLYSLRASISGAHNGAAFNGEISEDVTAESAGMRLAGSFTDAGFDLDSDGLLDGARFTFQTIGQPLDGEYRLSVNLVSPEGVEVAAAAIVTPANEVRVDVPADKLRASGWSGPWSVLQAVLWLDGFPVSSLDDAGVTNAYDLTGLERPNTVITGLQSESAIDTNGDGYFDVVNVTVGVDLLRAGSFGISGELRTSDDRVIDNAGIQSTYLSVGVNQVTLQFSGAKIGEFRADGPYHLRNLLVYPIQRAPKTTAYLDNGGQTLPYSCSQFFEVCVSSPVVLLDRLIGDTESSAIPRGIRQSLIAKLSTAKKLLERGNPAADRAPLHQIGAYINEVNALVGKHLTAEQAHLLLRTANLVVEGLRG